MVNPWRGLAGLPRTSWILAAATLINRAGVMVRPFLVIYLTEWLGFAPTTAGAMLAVYGATTLIAAPLSGRLCDRFGARLVLRGALFLSAVALLLYPLARGIVGIVAATVLFSLFNEMPRPALMTMVTEVAPPEKRKQAFVLTRLAINLGLSIGPALGGFIVAPPAGSVHSTHAAFLTLFFVDAGSNLAASLVLLATDLPRVGGAAASGPRRGGLARDPLLRLVFAACVLNAVVFWQHESALALFIKQHLHLAVVAFGRLFQSEEIYGLSITLNTLLIVLLEVELNLATAKWSHRRTLVLGALLVAFGFGGMFFARGVAGIACNVIVFTFGEMLMMPAMSALVADLAPPERRGAYMGTLTLAFGGGFAIGPWLGTNLLEWRGPDLLWPAMFVLGVLSALLFARVPENAAAAAVHATPPSAADEAAT